MSTVELNSHASEAATMPETSNLAMEGRIDSALQQVEQTRAQMDSFLHNDSGSGTRNDAGTTSTSPLEGLAEVFHNISDGIGHIFHVLLGIPDPVLSETDPQIVQIAHRLDMQVSELKQLQAVRHGAAESGAQLHGIQHGHETGAHAPTELHPQVTQMRHDVVAAREMFHHLSERMHQASMPDTAPMFREHSHIHEAHVHEPVPMHLEEQPKLNRTHEGNGQSAGSVSSEQGHWATRSASESAEDLKSILPEPIPELVLDPLLTGGRVGGLTAATALAPAVAPETSAPKVAEATTPQDPIADSLTWLGNPNASLPVAPVAQVATAISQAPAVADLGPSLGHLGSGTETVVSVAAQEAVKPAADASHPALSTETVHPAAIVEAAKPAAEVAHSAHPLETAQAVAEAVKPASAEAAKPVSAEAKADDVAKAPAVAETASHVVVDVVPAASTAPANHDASQPKASVETVKPQAASDVARPSAAADAGHAKTEVAADMTEPQSTDDFTAA